MAQITITQQNASTTGAPALTGVAASKPLVLVCALQRNFNQIPDISAVSGGNGTWNMRVDGSLDGNQERAVYIFDSLDNTSSSVTISLTGNFNDNNCVLYELSDGAFDVAAHNADAAGSVTPTVTTAALDSADDIAFSAFVLKADFGGGGSQSDADAPFVTDAVSLGNSRQGVAHLEVTSASALTCNWSNVSMSGKGWVAGIATYKVSGGGAVTPAVPGPMPTLVPVARKFI